MSYDDITEALPQSKPKSIELNQEGIFCPKCGSSMKPFGRKSAFQFRCLENPEHYSTGENARTKRKIILE